MKDKQHTPTPWVFNSRKEYLIGSNGDTVSVWNAGLSFGPRDAVTEANAEFIVRACNSHDALLEACKFGLKRCQDNGFPNGDLARVLENAIEKASTND